MAEKVRIADSDRLDDLGAAPGAACWVCEGETREQGPFCLGEIVQKEGDSIKVKIGGGKTVTKPLKELLGANDVSAKDVSDLTKLMYIHPGAVSDVLRQRFLRAQIYTYVGAMLLVVNPFKDLKLVTTEKVLQYRAMEKMLVMESKGEPHVFAVCAKSLHMFQETGDINLSFVISGESGAGKTETTKHILSFFTTPADGSDVKDPISTAIMAGNPILEAFGNATTQRNNNSSRFGRLIRLYCSVDTVEGVPAPKLHGGDVSPFLLEKSRITHAAEKERNYHVFYQICKSLPKEKLMGYGIPADWQTLQYLKRTKLFDVPNAKPTHDQNEFADMMEAFHNIKCTESEIDSILRLVAAVLLIGEIEVKQVGETDDVEAADYEAVTKAANMMGLEENAAGVGLFVSCVKKFRVIDGKETPCPLKVADAQNAMHCAGRAMFEKLFMWQIKKINDAVKLPEGSDVKWAAVLDIFGFEIMAVNSLEQLLINYANERLQQFFIANVFAKERITYSDEGIDPSCVSFEDNAGFILVIDKDTGRDCLGILSQLNSSCRNGSGTDTTFLNDCKSAKYPKEFFEEGSGVKAAEVFYLLHSMARVEYAVANFREKNMETLQQKQMDVMLSSSDAVLVDCFQPQGDGKEGFTGDQFKRSINRLLEILGDSTPFFLRCLKPNQTKIPTDYDYKCTVAQLNSLSILDALQLAQKGYPTRATYDAFMERNALVLGYVYQPEGEDSRSRTLALLTNVGKDGIAKDDFQEGKTKIFLKKLAYRFLENKTANIIRAGQEIANDMIRLASVTRVKDQYQGGLGRCLSIQAFARGWKERLVIQKILKRRRAFWGAVLWTFRTMRFKRDRLAAFTLQCTVRELKHMLSINELVKERRAASAKQNLWCYLQVVRAQRRLRECLEARARARQMEIVKKVARHWIEKEALRRFWTWRGIAVPARRAIRSRICVITKVQARIRGIICRASKTSKQLNEKVLEMRHRIAGGKACFTVQRNAKTFLLSRRFLLMHNAAAVVQYYIRGVGDRSGFVKCRAAASKIQSCFRGWVVRTLIIWRKLMVLHAAEKATTNRLTRNQRKRMLDFLGAKPLSLIHVTAHMDIRSFYPDGWLKGWEELLRRDGCRKLAIGAEHTVVLGQNNIYAWGSDEVGQLGIGEVKSKSQAGSYCYGLVVPQFKARVMDVACGRWHSVAVVEGNQPLFCWGLNHRGQCGLKTYQPGAAFTPAYPKVVRLPKALAIEGTVTSIAAGPFTSGAVIKHDGQNTGYPYCWGEGEACGQRRDVRLPMRIGQDTCSSLKLGDGYGMAVNGDASFVTSWGRRCSHLGIGAAPQWCPKSESAFRANRQLLRFDTNTFFERMALVSAPVPVRLPRVQVNQIAVGDDHVVALVHNSLVYEWGVRRIVKHNAASTPDQAHVRADWGLCHIGTPVHLDLSQAIEVSAAGDMSMMVIDGQSSLAWTFLETTSKETVAKPAVMQFRALKTSTIRLDATSSSSVTAVVGYSSLWKDLDIVEMDRERVARPRGAAQPVTPEMDGKPKPRPGMRMSMGTPISRTAPKALGITTPLSPTERMKEAMGPKQADRSKSPDRGGVRMTLRPSVALSPRGSGLSPPTTPRTPRAGEKGKVTPEKDFKRPVFLSPSFSGGGGVAAKPPGSAPSRSGKSQYSRGELGSANTLSRMESPRGRAAAPDQDPLSPKPARPPTTVHELVEGGQGTAVSDERARMMFEIQATLRNCSNAELSTIARQIRM
jgi:hypothetical protein